MSRSYLLAFRRWRASSWIRLALVWTIWLAPLHWLNLIAADNAGASKLAPWKRGISTWNGSSYSLPQADSASPKAPTGSSLGEPNPYTVPVDPKLYTEPLITVPQRKVQPTAEIPAAKDMPPFTAAEVKAPESPMPAKSIASKSAVLAELAAHRSSALPISPAIDDRLESSSAAATPSLQKEKIRWYQYPWRWVTTGWKKASRFRFGRTSR